MGQRKRTVRILPEVTITGLADKGRGVGVAPDGRVVFVEDVAPGDVVDIRVTKKRKAYFQGKPVHFHKYADYRIEPFCAHFEWCGGCKYQHIPYEKQLVFKQQRVTDAMERLAKINIGEMLPILGADPTRYYRNKLEFSFSSKRWLSPQEMADGVSNQEDVLGFHKAGAWDKVIDIQHCHLQPEPSNSLRNTMRQVAQEMQLSFFDARANVGFLRNMIVRTSILGQCMLIVVVGEQDADKISAYLDAIIARFPNLHSVYYCVNQKVNDFILDLPILHYYGCEYLTEQLQYVEFRIGPKSFFQTNTHQAIRLYDIVKKFAGLTGNEVVYDLYTGLGSIALYVAGSCKRIIGVEEVPEAIADAQRNAALNGIENAAFFDGDVRQIVNPEFIQQHGRPDVIITDPPRAGMHAKVTQTLLDVGADRIVYVSCNPATQARDIQLLSDRYQVSKLRAVDMFPHTHHIESVALLTRTS